MIICLLVLNAPICAQPDTVLSSNVKSQPSDSIIGKRNNRQLADSIIGHAETFLGDRYRRGGTGAKGFDCSGFTMRVFSHFGIKLPHTSAGQSFIGIQIPLKQTRKGDLIFFRGRNSRRKGIGHVGIVVSNGNEPVRFIHSSTSLGVRVDRLDAPYYKRRFMKVTRVLPLN